jgi:hypothetical protein
MGIPTENVPKLVGEDTRAALNQVVSLLGKYEKAGKLTGKAGAAKVLELKRALGETFDGLLSGDTPDAIKRTVMGVKDSFDTKLANNYFKAGVGNTFQKLNNDYSSKADIVKQLKRAMNSDNPQAVDELVKKFVSKSGSNRSLKDEALNLAELLGDKGKKMMEDLLDAEAAKGFVDFVPKNLSGNSATTMGKIASFAIQQNNPRAIAKQIQYTQKVSDFFKNLAPKQLDEFMKNDRMVQDLFRTGFTAAEQEEGEIENLLKQSGVR